MRTRSPSSAPPENGDDGSTARTPTRLQAFRNARTSAVVVVDLPTPGAPVSPSTCACPVCGASAAATSRSAGLAWATPQALRVLDAAGCDVVLIETVGVGQSELEVASLADTTLVLVAPGMGDGIQAAKAGILEVADLFVVNKADRDGADTTVRDLRYMQSLGGRHSEPGHWRPPICRTVASRDTDNGIDAVVEKIDEHRVWLESSGEGNRRREERAAREIEAIALAALRERLGDVHGSAALSSLADKVVAGETDPYTAADELVAQL